MTEKQFVAKCPHCSARLRIRQADFGSQRTCPQCKRVFAVPNPNPSQHSTPVPSSPDPSSSSARPAKKTRDARQVGKSVAATNTDSTAAARDTGPFNPAPINANRAATIPFDDWQPPVEVPIVCRVCRTRYYAEEHQIGQRLTCPDCFAENEVFPPPAPRKTGPTELADIRLTGGVSERQWPGRDPEQFRVVCRVCETTHYCLPKQTGEKVRCVDCGSVFTVPKPPEKTKARVQVNDPGIKMRPVTEVPVVKTNAGSLLQKAATKYHENEKLKPVPPKRPFREKVWSTPFQLEVLPIFLAVSLLGCFIPYLVNTAAQMDGLASLAGMMLMSAVVVLAMLTYMVLTTSLMAITVSSSMGITKIDFPRFEMLAAVMTGIMFFTSVSVSFGPGVSLGLILGIPWVSIVALPFAFVVFPFVFLSMLEAGSAAVPYTPLVASTLTSNRSDWIRFYLAALPAFLVATLPHGVAIWFQLSAGKQQLESPSQIVVFLATTCVSVFGVLVYFRLLGRLAWVLDQPLSFNASSNVSDDTADLGSTRAH